LIVSSTKIAIIAKNLVTRRITLFLKPLIKSRPQSMALTKFFATSVNMVNGQKLRVGFTTANTDGSAISGKDGQFKLLIMLMLALSAFIRMCLAIFRLMIHLSLPVLVIVFKGAFSCLHFMIGIPFSLMRWWRTICIKARQTIRLRTIRMGTVFTEFFKRFYFPAFRTSLVHIIII